MKTIVQMPVQIVEPIESEVRMTSNEMALMANIAVDMQKNEVNDVLDKIRAEIEHLTYYWCEINPKSVIDDVLEIIDKYKAESEEV